MLGVGTFRQLGALIKSYFVLLVAVLSGFNTVAASSAVEIIHYQLGVSLGQTDLPGGADITDYGVNGGLTVSLGQSVGLSLAGSYAKSQIDLNYGSCDVDNSAVGAGVFARASTVGRVGANYTRGHAGYCTSSGLGTYSESTENDNYGVYAEYYFQAVTIGVTRSRSDYDAGSAFDSASAFATWYVTPNVSLRLSAAGLDAKDTYRTSLEYQPAFLGTSTSLLLGYIKQPDVDTITVGFSYYFDKHFDLKTRDRQYR